MARAHASPFARPRCADLGYLAVYALTAVTLAATREGGVPLLGPAVGFVVLPLLDLVVGRDDTTATAEEAARLERALYYRVLLWCWVPVQLLLIALGLMRAAAVGGDPVALGTLALATGVASGGVGITVAHELGHKRNLLDWLCARVLLLAVCYLHFPIEHNEGHHLRVGTRADPATARLGEGFWRFLPRSVAGQYLHAWRLEHARLARRARARFGPSDRMLWSTLLPLLLGAAVFVALGPFALSYFVLQSALAIGLLEAVNYVEHYGLVRRELAPGVLEPVGAKHSWNASFRLTNWILFRLQRHADHHLRANVRYHLLARRPEAPELPAGYPAMILLALVPPLWHRVMDPRARRAREA
jgi:alkane 1-monooxygenase